MVFSSFLFLCVFLPLTIAVYYIFPSIKVKNGILIVSSLFFYAFGEPFYVVLLIFSIIVNYFFGLLLDKKKRKIFLILCIVFNLSYLFVFKYLDFSILSVNSVTPFKLKELGLSLPIGISFYTFQALSYVIDVYRGNVKPQKNLFKLMLYISFFPQLIAGPIIRYIDVEKMLSERSHSSERIKDGIIRFSIGLAKKILIANEVGKVADMIFAKDISEMNIAFAWLAAFTYMMQIYYDFSGYSDMAIGIGNIFGFKFAENFNYPYIAASIQDFWRRWHISLSSWFKEYVYIPLGGNRKGKARTILNKYIVFALTGIWHGANWTFLIWGLYHGTFLMIESLFKKSKKENSRTNKTILSILGFVYSFLVVCFGFVIFRADSLSDAFMIIKNMIGLGNLGIQPEIYLYLTPFYIFVYLTAFIGSTGVFKIIMEKIFKKNDYLLMALSVSYLLLCFMSLACDSYNPFIYFRF